MSCGEADQRAWHPSVTLANPPSSSPSNTSSTSAVTVTGGAGLKAAPAAGYRPDMPAGEFIRHKGGGVPPYAEHTPTVRNGNRGVRAGRPLSMSTTSPTMSGV